MKPALILAVLLLAKLALVVSCGGDSRGSAPDATPIAGTTADATPAAAGTARTGLLNVQRLPVKWVPAPSPLDIAGATEAPDPWAPYRDERLRNGVTDIGPAEWAVYVVEGNGEPRQVLGSKRWLSSLTWDNDGLRTGFATKRSVPSSEVGQPLEFGWGGTMTIDTASGRPTTQFDPFPGGIGTTISGTNRAITVEPDYTKTYALVMFTTGSRRPPAPGTPTTPALDAVYLLDAQGKARKLEGAGMSSFSPQWLPNGKTIVGRTGRQAYLFPATDGDVLKLEGVVSMATETRVVDTTQAELRVEGSRAVFALQTSTPGEVEFVVYDSSSHSLRSIGHSAMTVQALHWPSTLVDKVATQDKMIDVNTGSVVPLPPQQQVSSPPSAKLPASPSGRYILRFPQIELQGYETKPECRGLPYKIEVEDKQAGTTRTVLECKGGSIAYGRWLDEERLLVHVSPCIGGCDAQESRNIILEVATGRVLPLNEGFEVNTFAHVSPDANKVLVGGSKLRVFSGAGALIRQLDPPEGFNVTAGAWSPDGSSYAFILGPKNFLMGP